MKYAISQRSREYVRDRAQMHMGAIVTIYKSGDVGFDPANGLSVFPDRNSYYEGKARIWQVNEGDMVVSGEAQITQLTTNISIPWDAPSPKKDDIIVVVSNEPDTRLAENVFRVVYVDGGGYIGGTRRMRCVSLTESANWNNRVVAGP